MPAARHEPRVGVVVVRHVGGNRLCATMHIALMFTRDGIERRYGCDTRRVSATFYASQISPLRAKRPLREMASDRGGTRHDMFDARCCARQARAR